MYNYQPPSSQDSPKRPLGPEMISLAWQRLSEQMAPWVIGSLILWGVQVVIGIVRAVFQIPLQRGTEPGTFSPALIGVLIGFGVLQSIAQSAMMGGFYQMALNHLRGQSVSPGDVFKRMDLVGIIFAITFLTGLATTFGLVFCLLPGLLLSALFAFALPLAVDRGLSPIEAISTSVKALQKDMWSMLGLVFLLGLIQIGGLLACGIGVFWTTPLSILTLTIAYREYFPEEVATEPRAPAPPTILGGER